MSKTERELDELEDEEDEEEEESSPAPLPDGQLPEFRIIVKHPNKRGPLGPYRLTIAVAFALLVTGRRLWASVTSGVADEMLLLEAAGAALFAWIITSMISKTLGSVPPERPAAPSTDSVPASSA